MAVEHQLLFAKSVLAAAKSTEVTFFPTWHWTLFSLSHVTPNTTFLFPHIPTHLRTPSHPCPLSYRHVFSFPNASLFLLEDKLQMPSSSTGFSFLPLCLPTNTSSTSTTRMVPLLQTIFTFGCFPNF